MIFKKHLKLKDQFLRSLQESLESYRSLSQCNRQVHYRIGSLETDLDAYDVRLSGSLPYR